jgi:hypothetical protein
MCRRDAAPMLVVSGERSAMIEVTMERVGSRVRRLL